MKWLIRIVVALVLLVVLALLILLVPAHVQVRSVTPALPSMEQLLALKGPNGPSDVRYVLTSSQELERGQISHISILVEWANGDLFVIDTGMDKGDALDFALLLKKLDSRAGDATVHGTISELLGDDVQRVKGVGFTHLHIDHTQGLKNLCQARGSGAVGLQTSSQVSLHNFNTEEGAEIIANSCLKIEELSGQGLMASSRFPGLAAFPLGGHTPGSTLWAVTLNERILLFSGDTTNDKASIDLNKPKPFLYSNILVPENTKRTAELRAWLKKLDSEEAVAVIVSHDLANTKEHLKAFNEN